MLTYNEMRLVSTSLVARSDGRFEPVLMSRNDGFTDGWFVCFADRICRRLVFVVTLGEPPYPLEMWLDTCHDLPLPDDAQVSWPHIARPGGVFERLADMYPRVRLERILVGIAGRYRVRLVTDDGSYHDVATYAKFDEVCERYGG